MLFTEKKNRRKCQGQGRAGRTAMAASPSHLAANATAKPWRSSAANERAGSGCGAIREGPAGEDGSCLTATPAGPAKPSSSGGESPPPPLTQPGYGPSHQPAHQDAG